MQIRALNLMLFSQRIGKKPVKMTIQSESMDADLRNSLWNALQIFYLDPISESYRRNSGQPYEFESFLMSLWINFFKQPLDTMPEPYYKLHEFLRKWFFSAEWCEVYDLLEEITKITSPADVRTFRETCNEFLKRELSGWRFVDAEITSIINPQEIDSIETAIQTVGQHKLHGVRTHLKTALEKLSDRKSPDYRNSIKESISAVESLCGLVVGKKTDLSKALTSIEKSGKIQVHPALKDGFNKIYGYTGDGDGIRHALLEAPNLDLEDALFMLVSCSSFINYLMAKVQKAGLKLN
ncbi:MAG: hypothetical protein ABIA93_03880 [Candidatus Woesearchaeota archaeon]